MGVNEGGKVELGRPDETTRPDVSARRQAQKGKALYTLTRSARSLLARRAGSTKRTKAKGRVIVQRAKEEPTSR